MTNGSQSWTWILGPLAVVSVPVAAGLIGLGLTVSTKPSRGDVMELIDLKQAGIMQKLDDQKAHLEKTEKKLEEVDKALNENQRIMRENQDGINSIIKKLDGKDSERERRR